MTAFLCPFCHSKCLTPTQTMPHIIELLDELWPDQKFTVLDCGCESVAIHFTSHEQAVAFGDHLSELVFEEDCIKQSLGFADVQIQDERFLILPVCPDCG